MHVALIATARRAIAPACRVARRHTKAAIAQLSTILESGQSEQARIMAANSLLDRGWGKPTQPIAGDDDAPPIRVTDAKAILLAELARAAGARAE